MNSINLRVKVKIKEILKRERISLRELSRRTDIRHATLSELSNGKRERIQFHHIVKIAEEFNITDIREIIDFEKVDSK